MFQINKEDKLLNNYRFVDLFCGIGGFHLALSSFGAECVFASDINKSACEIYKKNFGIEPKGDITKIKCKEVPAHEILCAGFPCQPFSISGNRKGFDDPNGKLFFEVIRLARFHKPKIILLENVKNLQTHDNGNTLKTIKLKLDSIGYYSFEKVLNATYFGVPQARKRIYIIAFKKNLKIKNFTFPKENKEKYKSLQNVLLKEVDKKYYISRDYSIDNNLDNETNNSDKIIRIGKIGQGRQGERIYSIHGQSVTLSSQSGGLGGRTGIYLIDNKIRKLAPKECARLMGFPDSFKCSENDNACYIQFGNSVVVNVIQEIIKEASKRLKDDNNG